MEFDLQELGEEKLDYKLLGPPGWGLGMALTTTYRKSKLFRNLNQCLGRGKIKTNKANELENDNNA